MSIHCQRLTSAVAPCNNSNGNSDTRRIHYPAVELPFRRELFAINVDFSLDISSSRHINSL